MKANLEDLTFLFPLKPDSIIRIENLIAVTNYILRNFKANISILEVSAYNNGIIPKVINSKIDYQFIEDKDPVFHRTKYRNLMTRAVNTPFLAVWDVDVIVDKQLITDTIDKLRSGEADVAFPYDGKFYDTSEIIRSLFIRKNRIQLLHKNKSRMSLIYGNDHAGGAFIASTEKYKQTGMENENFYGWGWEDYERYDRWINLGLNIYRAPGCMYHLSHPRDWNGTFTSQKQMEISRAEHIKTWKSSSDELKHYYKIQ
jgi:predicted glycosyltransferase involved in capsule biosynthesis